MSKVNTRHSHYRFSRNRHKGRRPLLLAQINVTPLVDVMLVLLIIFMIATPMLRQGIDVELPQVKSGTVATEEEPLVITIKKDGRVFIERKGVSLSDLQEKLKAVLKARRREMVLLRADEMVPYGYVMKTMAGIRAAGVEKVGMVTNPLKQTIK